MILNTQDKLQMVVIQAQLRQAQEEKRQANKEAKQTLLISRKTLVSKEAQEDALDQINKADEKYVVESDVKVMQQFQLQYMGT